MNNWLNIYILGSTIWEVSRTDIPHSRYPTIIGKKSVINIIIIKSQNNVVSFNNARGGEFYLNSYVYYYSYYSSSAVKSTDGFDYHNPIIIECNNAPPFLPGTVQSSGKNHLNLSFKNVSWINPVC